MIDLKFHTSGTIAALISTVLLLTLCGQRRQTEETPESILAQMRADSSWIHELDSLAQIAIGPGAKCLDPVWHTFLYDGRTWFFNQDWGGVLEIPSDYLPEDDLWQAELTFHGTRAWSPDSLILVTHYAGFCSLTREERQEDIFSSLKEDGFSLQEWAIDENTLTLRAKGETGINYYERRIFANDDGVEYAVSVQYTDEKAPDALPVIKMADRYPTGPTGTPFKGQAL